MKLKYGSSLLDINIENNFDIFAGNYPDVMTDEQLYNTITGSANYSESVEDVIKYGKKILIVVPDITRRSGVERILPFILEIISSKEKDFNIIFATGTHRNMTDKEKATILGDNIFNKYLDKIIDHNSEDIDSLEYYGKTKNNTAILINKAYFYSDTIITIGSVSYHYFAGYGGGRKLIIPGIAAKKSALNNHKLALDTQLRRRNQSAVSGNLKNNPVHNDIVEALMIARAKKTFFSINTILNDGNMIVGVTVGDIFTSHINACNLLDSYAMINVDEKYDSAIISCGGFPKDINMVQAQKSLDRGCNLVKENGKILFIAECIDGYGNKYFEDSFENGSADKIFEELINDYQINKQTAFNLKSITEKYEVYLYSSFTKSDSERMGFTKVDNIEHISKIFTGKTAIVPNCYSILFKNQ